MAAELKVMSAGAVQQVVSELGLAFARETGHKIDIAFATVGAIQSRLKGGEHADLVIVSASAMDNLTKAGVVVAGSKTDLGRTVTGIVVRDGAPVPDVFTAEAFKQALLAARSVAYTDPRAGGSSGTYFSGLLERLGIAEAVNKKAVLRTGGRAVAQAVAAGEAEIGTTFISEILPVKGAKVAGPLPSGLENANTYAAGIVADSAAKDVAAAFIRKLIDPSQRSRWMAAGLEPTFPAR